MTTEELILRRIVVCASGLVYWGGVVVQARRIRRHIGRSPNLKPKGPKEKALWFGWFMVILVWIGQPFLVGATVTGMPLALLPGLLNPAGLAAGLALIVLGYAGTLWTYAAMGDAWRIGIDAKEKTSLVSVGPFRWVRHPIYSLQVVMLAGAALLLPTPASLAALLTHLFCVRIKAADEERFLAGVHGTVYRDYLSRTGGLFPKLYGGRTPGTNDKLQDGG
jgi:protein-S-isoprenylcysteine O-methyltransferase Ste14